MPKRRLAGSRTRAQAHVRSGFLAGAQRSRFISRARLTASVRLDASSLR
jgi:hypothetical protein